MNLRRNGELDDQGMALPIDDLEYRYDQSNPNQLIKVTDYTYNPSGFSDDLIDTNDVNNDYKYDDYGNMIRDDNKNIKNIVYNHLNLPVLIDFGALGRISYIYNAVGQKISKRVVDANLNTTVETFYVDGFQYKGDNLQFFPHAEGYVNCNAPKLLLVPTSDGGMQEVYLDDGTPTFSYVYNYTDHLGNIRLSYTKNPQSGALSIIEENHYYPFGLKHNNYNSDKNMYAKEQEQLKIKPVPPLFKPAYNYKYQGQERQDELGLNWDSFKWRNYDMAIGRFMSIDPLSEKFAYQSHYNFSEDRVVDSREFEGMEKVQINKETKNLIIAIKGWDGGNPDPGKTQAKPDKYSFSSVLVNAYKSQKDTQVAVFSSSMNSRTLDDVSESIQDFRNSNPDGKLVIAAHSMGADNAVEVLNNNLNIKVDGILTLDISDPGRTANNQITSNATVAKNYYQTSSLAGGTKIEASEGNSTSKIVNFKTDEKTTHTNIDNRYRWNILKDVKKIIPIK
ncbi:hypothetical protein OX284_004180 [Flavobacterium sp. SUN046]|uniref:RHS repeat domain-containing protein n=1 Tax=Flavobacterium sp. SUN046 TaxID=3002440 RepID=UPI002DB9C266|nr:hypothetical protein [Flavobacterium sp. SUN046]MEC4048616.1 hypothetical protein [Flavobacterium sp. SUN046]